MWSRWSAGGRSSTSGFNRALDARRPIGSLVKPAVYLTALETGRYTAATLIEDAPIELKLADGSVWAPQNFERQVYGQVPLARALAESMNLATVRLGLDLGLPKVAATLERLGLESSPTLNPSLLLGTVEMSPLEVVQVYTTLADGGFRTRLRAVRAVLDEQGRRSRRFKVQVEAAAPPAAVYQLDRMLMLVPTHGTAREAAARLPPGLVIAGKTGTSSDTRDSWFAGFTGSYLAVAWVGYDDNRETGLTGARAHCRSGPTPWRVSSPSPSIRSRPRRWRIAGSDSTTDSRRPRPAARMPWSSACRRTRSCPSIPNAFLAACRSSPHATTGDKIKEWLKSIVH